MIAQVIETEIQRIWKKIILRLMRIFFPNKSRPEVNISPNFYLCSKLMQFNQPKAKICFKSDSNRLLIDFFDPNLLLDFESSRRNRFQQMVKKIKKFDFRLIFIENGQI